MRATVAVAHDGAGEGAQALYLGAAGYQGLVQLLGIAGALDGLRQQDEARAGAQDRQPPEDAFPQRTEHVQFGQQLPLGRALAAGKHQAVEGPVEVGPLAQLDHVAAQVAQLALVLDECALHRQHGDGRPPVRLRRRRTARAGSPLGASRVMRLVRAQD